MNIMKDLELDTNQIGIGFKSSTESMNSCGFSGLN
jgi:hypothetical protein